MRPASKPDHLLTVHEAARLLTVSPSQVRNLIAQEKLPAYRVAGNNVRILRSDLDRAYPVVAGCAVPPPEAA